MARSLPFVVIILMLAFSCKKRQALPDPNPKIGAEPQITLDKVSSYDVVALQDPIVFTIGYLDGDGDIGFESADSTTVYITDNRVPLTHEFAVQPLAPLGSGITIQGVLKVTLDNTILIDPNATFETATFSIQLRDRAGNWSNKVTTGNIGVNQ